MRCGRNPPHNKGMQGMAEMSLKDRLKELMEHEARSCSMDPGCITPLYVYRMWGGSVSLEEIEKAMEEVRRKM